MAGTDLVAEMRAAANLEDCPAQGERSVLWALLSARSVGAREQLTAAETGCLVTQVGRHSMSRQSAQAHLVRLADEGLVHRERIRNAPDQYAIMGNGEDRLRETGQVVVIDPSRALREIRKLEAFLATMKGRVAICDPYLDSRSLDFVACLSNAVTVRYLTERITDREKVKRELKAVEKQAGATIEVRLAPKGLLHDRFMIHDGGMLILGASLNGFGLRQAFVSRVGQDVRVAMLAFFDDKWKNASIP